MSIKKQINSLKIQQMKSDLQHKQTNCKLDKAEKKIKDLIFQLKKKDEQLKQFQKNTDEFNETIKQLMFENKNLNDKINSNLTVEATSLDDIAKELLSIFDLPNVNNSSTESNQVVNEIVSPVELNVSESESGYLSDDTLTDGESCVGSSQFQQDPDVKDMYRICPDLQGQDEQCVEEDYNNEFFSGESQLQDDGDHNFFEEFSMVKKFGWSSYGVNPKSFFKAFKDLDSVSCQMGNLNEDDMVFEMC